MIELPYDDADPISIFEYSQHIVGHTLEEVVPSSISETITGKGKLGQLVEKCFFLKPLDNNAECDFPKAGLELKCTPLKKNTNGRLANKERLSCALIDYNEVWHCETFTLSKIYKKCALILLLFYLHQDHISVQQLRFLFSCLWKIPEKDLLIMSQDYQTIINKIRDGRADELSEGDTTYLGACRKGQKGDNDRIYVASDGKYHSAPSRAFSLKPAYMKTILDLITKSGLTAVTNIKKSKDNELVSSNELFSVEELRHNSFDGILINRLTPFYGLPYNDACQKLGIQPTNAKNKYAILINEIITQKKNSCENYLQSEEMIKSGIVVKTVRMQYSGTIKEATSFPAIDYCEIVNEEWYSSKLYDLWTQRFFFVVFKETCPNSGEYALCKSFFWTMPKEDLQDAEIYWNNIKDNVLEDNFSPNLFYQQKDHLKFHVRPHAKDSYDLTKAPSGRWVKKYGYWFNKEYVADIVRKG